MAQIIFLLLILSAVLALFSLARELQKSLHEQEVKKKLEKGKVVFYSSSSSSE